LPDVSGSGLDDIGGAYLARMLKQVRRRLSQVIVLRAALCAAVCVCTIAGSYARVCPQNQALVKLEAGSNQLGPRTCVSLAQSLAVGTVHDGVL
jgi:hypothetical protein